MSRLEKLSRKMTELEHNGDIDEEYATYKALLAERESLLACARKLCGDWANSETVKHVTEMAILIDKSWEL